MRKMKHKIGTFLSPCLAYWLALLIVAPASAQVPCRDALERAEDQYDAGQYQQVIAVLQPCLPNEVPTAGQLRAYKLLALAYLLTNDKGSAKTPVREILKLNPRFEADATQDPPPFVDLVNEVKAERPKSKKWLWIGGGGLVAGAVAAFLIFKQEESDLPDPPLPP
jgi:hypothetical protein